MIPISPTIRHPLNLAAPLRPFPTIEADVVDKKWSERWDQRGKRLPDNRHPGLPSDVQYLQRSSPLRDPLNTIPGVSTLGRGQLVMAMRLLIFRARG